MSRNTFILLGLLTGSVAMIGCSKNITAPEMSTDRQAGVTVKSAAPIQKDLNEVEKVKFEARRKAEQQMLGTDEEGGSAAAVAVPRRKDVNEIEKVKFEARRKAQQTALGTEDTPPSQVRTPTLILDGVAKAPYYEIND